MHCLECDRPVRALGLCGAHYQQARHGRAAALRTTDRLDEVEHLTDGGVWPPNAVKRCGWTIAGAEKAARTNGRTRLSELLQKHASEARNRDRTKTAAA